MIETILPMDATELQLSFFKHLKERIAANISFVDEIAELLNVSTDSAYRRIRAEKTIDFNELKILCRHFEVSLDKFFLLNNDALLFSGKYINREYFDFENHLKGMVEQLQYFNTYNEKELFYLNKDVPIFHHFMFPELACFKCYFWCRYNLNYPQFNKGKFLIDNFIEMFNIWGKRISDLYIQIPSTEVWNLDCINTTIRQIDYYRDSKIFASHDDIVTVYDCLYKLVDHIESQVEYGVKFQYNTSPENSTVRYRVFINEFILGDNTVIIKLDNDKIVSLNHNVINYVMTRNEKFVDYTYQTLQTILKKSTLISEIGEKDRQLFFDTLRERIHEKRKLL